MPSKFVVPNSSDWPEQTWGMRLGQTVSNIRRDNVYKKQREDLINMGFEFTSCKNYKYELIKSALLRYEELHNNLRIPRQYVIPHDRPEWPTEMWGMQLGRTVTNIRLGNTYKDMRDDLFDLLNLSFCLKENKTKL